MSATDEVVDAVGEEVVLASDVIADLRQQVADLQARTAPAVQMASELTVDEMVSQKRKLNEVMLRVMVADVHYGVIPGTQKPTLYKPGAEVLMVVFRLAPRYHSRRVTAADGHLDVMTRCELWHVPSGLFFGEGEGSCSTRETKYAWRQGARVCPECSQPTVRVSGPKGGRPGNWYCWQKAGVSDGCGATWPLDSDQARLFEQMETGKVPNPDLPDAWNTVLKMANKRALVAAVLNCTAASDTFTQDMEDTVQPKAEPVKETAGRLAKPRSWKAWLELAEQVAPNVGWDVWLDQAAVFVYGDHVKDLPKEVKAHEVFDASFATLQALSDGLAGRDFPPATRGELAAAFSQAWGCEVLAGPAWRLSPDETDRPTKQKYDEAAQTAPAAQENTATDHQGDAAEGPQEPSEGLLGPMPKHYDSDIEFGKS